MTAGATAVANPRTRLVLLALAIAGPVLLGLALVPFRESVNSANLALVLVVVVVAVACFGSITNAVLCALVTALSYDVLLVKPYGSLTIAQPDEILTTCLLLVVGVAVGSLAAWARNQRARAERREENLGLLYQMGSQISSGTDDRWLIELAEHEIRSLLDARSCRYASDLEGADALAVDTSTVPTLDTSTMPTVDRAGLIDMGSTRWEPEHGGLPTSAVAVPVVSAGLELGRFVVEPTPGAPVARWQLIMSLLVADLVGAALARWPEEI